jgi:hypothetical protein
MSTDTSFLERLMITAPIVTAGLCASAALLISCSDSVTAPSGEALSVCHVSGSTGTLVDIRTSELPTHKSHGDYVARLIVDKNNASINDSIHFTRITDALAVARARRLARNETSVASCRITIAVGSGLYQGSVKPAADPTFERLPLMIDVPNVTLLGTFVMPVDQQGRALGSTRAPAATASTLVASPGLLSIRTGNVADKFAEPLIVVNGHPDGSHGDGAVIEGFVFQSGNEAADAIVGGNAVWAMRANGLVVRGNQIEGGFAEPIEMRASVGRIERNFLKGHGASCALCAFGPGDYQIVANRQSGFAGRLGILVFPTLSAAVPPGVEPLVLPASALVTVAVTNNDLRDHQEVPFGIGLRVAGIGPGAPDVIGTARVTAQDNDLSNNRFGIVVEAGFPVANTALRGSVELTLHGNTLTASCQNAMLVTLTSQPTAVGLQTAPSSRNSTYTIALGGDIAWSNVWYSHPAGAGNTLTVDGQAIDNGSRVPYDAAKSCPVQ